MIGGKPVKIVRYVDSKLGTRMGLVIDGRVYDLTSLTQGHVVSFDSLLAVSEGNTPRFLFQEVLPRLKTQGWYPYEALDIKPSTGPRYLIQPLDPPEVWAAGVTYEQSRMARENETKTKSIYDRVYDAPRPEIFFKATPNRITGPFGSVCLRSDSKWMVPEPELGLVLGSSGHIIGYIIGNDMSCRDIEVENPL